MIVDQHTIEEAHARIKSFIRETALEESKPLSVVTKGNVLLKMENQQVSGSFKARGAFNKILSLSEEERKSARFIAASTGNHAVAFCTVLDQLGLDGKVVLPENVSPAKLNFIRLFGIPIEFHGTSSLAAEIYAREESKEKGYTLVHPYDDPWIIAGQGTVAIEVVDKFGPPDVMIVPVGGGGLISGIATYLKERSPTVQIIGCQPERSPEMVVSIQKGSIVKENISTPTLSDGTAGGMEPGCITFDICRQHVDEWILLAESEIANAIRFMIEQHQIVVEGAGALAVASVLRKKKDLEGKKVVCVVSGKRISKQKLMEVLQSE